AVSAVERIGEKALLNELERFVEECLAVGAIELDLVGLEPAENRILLIIGQIRERLAAELRRAVAIERGEAIAYRARRSALVLRPLLLRALHEGRTDVVAVRLAVGPGELPVDEDGATHVLAAGCLRVGRNEAVGDRLHGAPFRPREEAPGPGP